jgi:hypothetical protein
METRPNIRTSEPVLLADPSDRQRSHACSLGASDARLEIIERYEANRLRSPDPFERFATLVQGGLFRDALSLGEKVLRAVAGCSTVKSLKDVEPLIKRYLDITRRIAANAEFERYTRLNK